MLTRYIGKMLIQRTFLLVLGLTMAAWVGQSLRFTRLITQCNMSSYEFLKIAVYLLPDLFLLTLPIGFALSVGIVYQQLHLSCQLVVLRSIGTSPATMARPILLLGVGIMGLLYGANTYFSPLALQYFKNEESRAIRQIQILSAAEGGKVTDHEGISIFARQKDEKGALLDIIMHDRHDPATRRSVYAKRGHLLQQEGTPRLILEQGERNDFNTLKQQMTTVHFDKYEADLSQASLITHERTRKPHELFFAELFPDPSTVSSTQLNRLHAEGHHRLINPLLVLIFSLISFLMILKSEGERKTSAKNFFWIGLSVTSLECLDLSIFNLANEYPVLNFVHYGITGGLLIFLLLRLLTWKR
ncbi:MAG: LptF/LptG family permease [Holosporales bacterium]|jgi:lipopolysaccharide export system permease protein|nr:LptF/LptG family permease [Holosporales bacterium]